MTKIYQEIGAYDGVPVNCGFLDFGIFSVAVVLAADLVSPPSQQSFEEEEWLWTMVVELAQNFRHTAHMIDCMVATQSAEVLEYLYAARHGTYDGPEPYEVAIPYFGTVHIRPPKSQVQEAWSSTLDASHQQEVYLSQSSIEFESNAFRIRQPIAGRSTYELAEDWTTALNLDGPYDWNCVFDFSGPSL